MTPDEEIANLKRQLGALEAECGALSDELEYERVLGAPNYPKDEIKVLREFIEDVRLGIRGLDEYEMICDPIRL